MFNYAGGPQDWLKCPASWGKLGLVDDVQPEVNLWKRLARPVPLRHGDHTALQISCPSRPRSLSALERLPPELMAMIFDDTSFDERDVVALGLSSVSLWQHMLLHIEKRSRAAAADWAGMEMMITGNRIRELPGVFLRGVLASESVENLRGPPYQNFARRYSRTAELDYDPPPAEDVRLPFLRYFCLFAEILEMGTTESSSLGQQIRSACHMHSFDDPELSWFLRNLDTHELVSCGCVSEPEIRIPRYPSTHCALISRRGYVKSNGGILKWLPIELVVLARICWGGLSAGWRQYSSQQGPWAGHRFDIVALGSPELKSLDGWIDITTEIVKQAETFPLRRENYGGPLTESSLDLMECNNRGCTVHAYNQKGYNFR
ncbi:MAG: hypothetical protein M1822_000578 [Bathelium mastoideum]|nr:MAG: hypothetical protein M1822_000578 [Bathelium mastoideum]